MAKEEKETKGKWRRKERGGGSLKLEGINNEMSFGSTKLKFLPRKMNVTHEKYSSYTSGDGIQITSLLSQSK